jgi:hypothetical protein
VGSVRGAGGFAASSWRKATQRARTSKARLGLREGGGDSDGSAAPAARGGETEGKRTVAPAAARAWDGGGWWVFEAGAADPGPGGLACGRAVSDSRSHAGAFWPGRGCGGAEQAREGHAEGPGRAELGGRAGGPRLLLGGWGPRFFLPFGWVRRFVALGNNTGLNGFCPSLARLPGKRKGDDARVTLLLTGFAGI